MKIGRNIAITLVCIILGIIVALQYKSTENNQKLLGLENKRESELKDELLIEKRNNENLRKRLNELEGENLKYKDASGQVDKTIALVNDELKRSKIIAGMTEVKGKGIIVTLDNKGSSIVNEDDILNVINELRASDAQAISVNNERIVAMSEVRVAGSYIMINSRQMVSPFVIKAIADQDKVESSLKLIGGLLEKLEIFLKVKSERSDNIIIPKVRDDVVKSDLLMPVK